MTRVIGRKFESNHLYKCDSSRPTPVNRIEQSGKLGAAEILMSFVLSKINVKDAKFLKFDS